jgi:hypothetical protein
LVTNGLTIIQAKWPIKGAKQPYKWDRQPIKQKQGTTVAFKQAKQPFRGAVLDPQVKLGQLGHLGNTIEIEWATGVSKLLSSLVFFFQFILNHLIFTI